MSQHPTADDDAEPTDGDSLPQGGTNQGQVTKTRKYLWVIGAGVGVYMIARGLWDMFTGAS